MPKAGNQSYKDGRKNGRSNRNLWIFLPILLLFVSISSFLAGTHIGRATDHRLGQMLDTIVLSPESETVDPNRIDFGGRIFYTDGTPCANRLIELHSDPKRTTTDSEGVFHFKDVEIGKHNLAMLDDAGQIEGEIEINIDRTAGVKSGQVTGGSSAAYQLNISENVIEVQIHIIVDDDKGMTVEPEVYTRSGGNISNTDASGRKTGDDQGAGENERDDVPESGEGLLDEGNIQGEERKEEDLQQETPGGMTGQLESGQLAVNDTAAPESEAQPSEVQGTEEQTQNNEKATEGTNQGIQGDNNSSGSGSSSGNRPTSPTRPDPTKPTQTEPTQPEPTNPPPTEPTKPTKPDPTDPSPTEPTKPTSPTEPTEPEPTDPTPTEPTEPPTEPTKPTEPAEPLNVDVEEKGGPVWTQNTAISLFADRTGVGADRKLLPGSKGSYEFLVSNGNTYKVAYRMKISAPAGQLLIPLRYRLKSDNKFLCGGQNEWLTSDQLSAKSVTLDSGEQKEYLLEWQWLYEGGNDALDTKIGSAANLEYQVIVTIEIEQVIS
ncbi:hypothetical protein [Clostridium sp. AM58-1XD]|uniref:hypothetical protein n=1 Tax=Clostridium sp. AM58-1XD TaxID=2292307 RepID=UPI0015F465A1|nr:hypothetical protein [Clostridium sp. AM58-1XD]